GEPDGEEPRAPLVDPHVQVEGRGAVRPLAVGPRGRGGGVRERRAARAGGEHDVPQPQVREGAQQHAGGGGRGGHESSFVTARRRASHRSVIPAAAAASAARASRAGSGSGRRTARRPPTGRRGSATTSSARSRAVASPHAYGSSGRAAASASPCASPTEVSRADETTTGTPTRSASSRQAR